MAVSAQNDTSVVVAEYRYFADDRRAARNVDYRGSLNGDRIYVYDHQEIIEERNGSEAVVEQYVFGPNHVDELLMVRGSNGTRFVYQGERSERERVAMGKTNRMFTSGPRGACSE